jgi:ABC-type amino acid transport substrate-binding protein
MGKEDTMRVTFRCQRVAATVAACLALVVALLPVVARAQSALNDVKKRGKMIVGVKTDFPPFGSVDAAGTNVGFDVDVSHELAKALFGDPNKLELVSVTSGNRIPYLQSGKIDIIVATVTVTDERRKVVEFSDPYFLSGALLLVPKTSAINDTKDLNGKKVAVIQGAITDQDIAELAPQATRLKYGKVTEAVLAVKAGHADAFAQDDILILKLAKDNPDLRVAGKPFQPRPYGIAVRKGDTEFIGWVNAQLKRMHADGTYDRIWKKYVGEFESHLLKP